MSFTKEKNDVKIGDYKYTELRHFKSIGNFRR